MQTIIICGGLATRLRPYTEKIPKSMLEINGRPVLWYQLNLLKKQGIKDIILCVGHLSEVIEKYFEDGRKFSVELRYSRERELLGTAGAVKNIPENWIEEKFGILYGDIISDLDFRDMLDYHEKNDAFATMLMRIKKTLGSSLINADEKNNIKGFIERPTQKVLDSFTACNKKNWVNSGAYIYTKEILKFIDKNKNSDFSYDIFPQLLKENKKIMGYPVKGFWKEIGNIQRLNELEKEIKELAIFD